MTCKPDATHHEGCACHEARRDAENRAMLEAFQARCRDVNDMRIERDEARALAHAWEEMAEHTGLRLAPHTAMEDVDVLRAKVERIQRERDEARAEVALMREEIESQERAHAEVIARHMALHRYDQRVHAACVAARAKLHQAMRYTGLMRGDLVREAIDLLTAGPERMPDN